MKTLQKVKVVEDESGHWYVIPADMLIDFRIDEQDDEMIDSGIFDIKWSIYMTGGDLNNIQLFAEI